MPFVTKDLSKGIMKILKLRNSYLQNKPDGNRMLHKKQRNCYVSLLKKSKTNYYANVSDNNLFWIVINPSISDKSGVKEQVNLLEKLEILRAPKHSCKSKQMWEPN